MHKPVLLIVLLATALAQVLPSCGAGEPIIGWVERKFSSPRDEAHYIEINHVEYAVPFEFWMEVRIGDLVKYENSVWTIVRKGG